MCSLDLDDVCPVWRETPRMARKPHMCWGCGLIIAPGQPYLSHAHVYDGAAASEAMCFGCWWAREVFSDEPEHHLIPVPSALWDTLAECIDGDNASPWRSLLAGVKARWRTSPSGRDVLARKWAQQRAWKEAAQ